MSTTFNTYNNQYYVLSMTDCAGVSYSLVLDMLSDILAITPANLVNPDYSTLEQVIQSKNVFNTKFSEFMSYTNLLNAPSSNTYDLSILCKVYILINKLSAIFFKHTKLSRADILKDLCLADSNLLMTDGFFLLASTIFKTNYALNEMLFVLAIKNEQDRLKSFLLPNGLVYLILGNDNNNKIQTGVANILAYTTPSGSVINYKQNGIPQQACFMFLNANSQDYTDQFLLYNCSNSNLLNLIYTNLLILSILDLRLLNNINSAQADEIISSLIISYNTFETVNEM